MKISDSFKSAIVEAICLLYILLFVYASVSKIIDFENFQVQLGQSPLLSAFAVPVSWGVIISELGIALMLVFPGSRKIGLYAGFCLMTMFSAYIFIILNYSSFVPCSCGGILEKMSWGTHLAFNIVFVLLAALAITVYPDHNRLFSKISNSVILSLIFISGSGAVAVLFLASEKIMHYQNPFIRRYPHHPVSIEKTIDLKYNSYYFAGYGEGNLYLGNSTAPFSLLSISSQMEQKKIRIRLDRERFDFKSVRIAVRPPFFYVLDGVVPVIFQGKTSEWKALQLATTPPYFNIAYPADSTLVVFRGMSSKTRNNVIGTYRWGKNSRTIISPHLLQKQIDGIFDTDGMLHFSQELNSIIYLYSYRNEYLVADREGKLNFRSHTIDTNSHAKIKVAYLKGKSERVMSAPAITVNRSSSVNETFLYVNSNVPGRFEGRQKWELQSVIDVYDLKKRSYVFSFTIDRLNGKKLRNFYVVHGKIFVLIGTKLAIYKFSNEVNKKYLKAPEA
ncbi:MULTISPECIES: MauE/DoxX family redox-associated membrane protein [Flavobacterium]|uniref:Methylamine utilisation protein MauE domain-containing protein n=1 Tax=Flavobacterium johnsoniae (strain ATCC 17061 / DSM 2064 / JCM 8514 / BCRC 14874 / CCUG 350202 / NBRC 14942 / NCIMB 11054 / UW101) TaxID=376686 RepID=A5FFG4_FLAJ1|nr:MULTISPECIES: MauE/DoxX family redox-associated membrane protein [Flavobacterium]ABQ06059.1 hypothetical protein Fjoh_3038 [Flavobacterium johnsoniae UW101]EJG02220.1 hypothetical protein FF52_06055 [Flavobacterium sp. F52]OXG00578.1 hypothetical protein B0A63_08650 [Flavobacterium johnsoniae UW101]WQG81798.1 hypothetical protein SR927_01585 [Flavobacterium johnsoniae UW101]SHK64594.1 hypothetical protein SAMN05444146_1768 [Flavobacterium johnsoniae]